MFSIRKSVNYNAKKTDKIEKRVRKSRKRVVNYKRERALKYEYFTEDIHDNEEYNLFDYSDYISDDYSGGSSMNFFIRSRKYSSIVKWLKDGYNPDSSFGKNCPCCQYEIPDDLTNCFWKGNIEAFRLLLPKTNPELILSEQGVRIWGKYRNCVQNSIPYLKIMSEHFDVPSSYLLDYIAGSKPFDVDLLRGQLLAIGKTEDSIDIRDIRLGNSNRDYYEHLLTLSGKLDLEFVLSKVLEDEMYLGSFNENERDTYTHIGQTCIRLGADTSKVMEFGLSYWTVARELSIDTVELEDYNEVMKISLDELMVHVNKFLSEGHEVPEIDENRYYAEVFRVMGYLKDIYTGGKYEHALTIQCFYRVFRSVKIVKDLRSLPENLFDTEFSTMRKKLMNIDDSVFCG